MAPATDADADPVTLSENAAKKLTKDTLLVKFFVSGAVGVAASID